MALPYGATGSLRPTFVSARLVCLTVKLAYAFTLSGWFPISLSQPSCASVTFLEATAPVKLPTRQCPRPRVGPELEPQRNKGGISTLAPPQLAPELHRLPPILHMPPRSSLSSYSKGSWGLSVLPRVDGIFTANTISLSPWSRQRGNRYAIHAGRNLPDKEFRYLRTVIVTAAVYWGFGSTLLLR